MVACLAPSDKYFEENLSTLQYASRASYISNMPKKNVDPQLLAIQSQKKHITDLELELRSATQQVQFLTAMVQEKEKLLNNMTNKYHDAKSQLQKIST